MGYDNQHINGGAGWFVPGVSHALRGEGFDASEDGTGRGTPLVPEAIRTANTSANGHGLAENVAHTLDQAQGQCVAIQAGAIKENPDIGPDGVGIRTDGCAYTLEARAEVQAVAFNLRGREGGAMPEVDADNLANIRAASGGSSRTYVGQPIAWSIMPQNSGKDYKAGQVEVLQPLMAGAGQYGNQGGDIIQSAMQVRRLTPVECERLQGFPDGWTEVPHRGKPAADGPRYKALGNSMAVPVMHWIGERIQAVDQIAVAAEAA